MSISASAVKELREKSGAGMMDCKKALTECDGNMEEAVDWLRKKGLAAAAKKSGRTAAEGLVAVAIAGGKGAIIELNSETDFVARNEQFQQLAATIAKVASESANDLEGLKAADFPGTGRSVVDEVTEAVGTIGENLQLRRASFLEGDVLVPYVHNAAAEGLGKIGVLVALKTSGDKDKTAALGKKIAMHVAAAKPESLNVDDLDPALVERERQVLTDQAKESGKPDNVIEKMIEGRIRKFYAEVVLLEQAFVIDGKTPVKQAIADEAKDIGGDVEVTGYVRLTLGEGVEKEESDFAAEVAAAAGGN